MTRLRKASAFAGGFGGQVGATSRRARES